MTFSFSFHVNFVLARVWFTSFQNSNKALKMNETAFKVIEIMNRQAFLQCLVNSHIFVGQINFWACFKNDTQ